MKKLFILILLSILSLVGFYSCTNSSALNKPDENPPELQSSNHLTMAVLYQQKAAEYRALCYQSFNLAKMQVNNNLKLMGMSKPYAIIIDIDETVLDNSPHEAKCIQTNTLYPEHWEAWMNSASAKAIPGALEFLNFATSKKVQIFYVSNRDDKFRDQTLKNLNQLNFPNADHEHLLLKTNQSSKKERWERVNQKFKVILYIGDNLNDFSEAFERRPINERFDITDRMKTEFGTHFIVLPNAMYGAWEGALYHYDYSKSSGEKADFRYNSLIGF